MYLQNISRLHLGPPYEIKVGESKNTMLLVYVALKRRLRVVVSTETWGFTGSSRSVQPVYKNAVLKGLKLDLSNAESTTDS
jgi:hypothetical protein